VAATAAKTSNFAGLQNLTFYFLTSK